MYDFKDKVVFVTGASRGIGNAIALAFAKRGARVAINATKKDRLFEALEEIKIYSPNSIALVGDVADYNSCEKMLEEIKQKLGNVNVLVNNAGIAHIGLFSCMKYEEIKRIVDVNLMGAMNCSHLVIEDMVREKSGSIINISSMWGNVGASCEAVYSASKGGLNLFTRALGKELAPSKVRVNAIACGVVDTEMNDTLAKEEKEALMEEIPMMRFAQPEEIAKTALFLASEEASYITAQIITMDGAMN